MKKFLYKLLPLILIFVFMFSFSINASSSTSSVYCDGVINETDTIIYKIEFYSISRGVGYIDSIDFSTPGWDGCRVCFYLKPFSPASSGYKMYLYGANYSSDLVSLNTSTNNSSTISNQSITNLQPLIYSQIGINQSSPSTAFFETNIPIFASEEDALAYQSNGGFVVYAINYMHVYDCETESWVPVTVEEPPADNDFFFGAFEDFADFGEQSSTHYNNAMNQIVTENSNNPNDSVFQNLLQAMVGSLTTNNSISQQISNQLQHFSEQFFNNFAQYSLGLMNDILNTLNEFTGKFDSLLEITGQLYESGLDSEGNFDVGTMLSYWFVPDVDGIKRSYDNTIGQINTFDVVTDTMLGFLSSIQEVEPVAPIFTIPAGTYGLLTLKEDILIKFDWFESWKPYTDPLIAAFIYVTFFWHLFKQLPGIISGSAATTATVGHFNDAAIKDANRKAKGG